MCLKAQPLFENPEAISKGTIISKLRGFSFVYAFFLGADFKSAGGKAFGLQIRKSLGLGGAVELYKLKFVYKSRLILIVG
ncbi:MAG: hypothetical protein BRD49_05840 [Bacteroidetes bacterium SW_10_40_5]|nr:MAG: hypothetical protein BRD49_05840 [Bacteroidetes bacterium SW_10_40_5]